MANPEHVDILMQGVDVWNKWREENPEIKPDLSGMSLLSKVNKPPNLWDDKIQAVDLEGIDFSNTILEGSRLNEVYLRSATFVEAELGNASFEKSFLEDVWFTYADLNFANLNEAILLNADFTGAFLQRASLEQAFVAGVTFSKSTKCSGIRASTCFGSQLFKTFAQDQDYLEEYREKHPILYRLWFVFADCGRSFWPWALWSLIFAVLFAALYYGVLGPESFHINGDLPPTFLTMTYYSVVTFTTLGFGDLTPATTTAAVFVMFEVVLGYIMLGGLISILANKLARRA